MSCSNQGRFLQQVRFWWRSFLQDCDLPLTRVLSQDVAAQASQLVWKDRTYTPMAPCPGSSGPQTYLVGKFTRLLPQFRRLGDVRDRTISGPISKNFGYFFFGGGICLKSSRIVAILTRMPLARCSAWQGRERLPSLVAVWFVGRRIVPVC